MRSDIEKLAAIILLPIYVVILLLALILGFFVIITHQEENRFLGRSVRRLCIFSEKFYYKFYGKVDERD